MKSPHANPWILPICLLAAVAAISSALWSWHQSARPGRVHFERGLDYATAKQLPQAEQEWQAGVREDPKFPDNYAQLGDLYSAQGRFREATIQYEAAARLMPKDGTVFLRLAKADEAVGEDKAALAAADRAAVLRPEDAAALRYDGILNAKMNRPAAALGPLARTVALSPDDAEALIYLVRVKIQKQDLAGAEHDLTPFVQRHPDNAEACYLMAYLLQQKPQAPDILQTALDYAHRAHAGAPGNAQASTLLGQLLLTAAQPAEALPVFRQALAVTPSSITVLHGLATCYIQLGQPAQAAKMNALQNVALARFVKIAHCKDLLSANPTNIAAILEMAHLREENGEPILAQSYYEQAVHHAPKDARAQAALAGFLRRVGGQASKQPSK